MTIDSGWVKLLKQNVPQAFKSHAFQKGGIVFIDGQVKLMKPDYINTWDLFVAKQFVDPIDKLFLEHDAKVIVLGFDNYKYVPKSKHMTQRKRSQHVPDIMFCEHDSLPSVIPERWDAAMRNRTFKTKVVNMVVARLNLHYSKFADRTVVIDYSDNVQTIGRPWKLPDMAVCRGECDIKAFAYAQCGEPLLIVSTDGDFVPLSLAQIEKAKIAGCQSEISLLRLKTRVDKEPSKNRREHEYVNMPLLYAWVERQFHKCERPAVSMCAMIAATGCDFSLNLPQIGPLRMWAARSLFNNRAIEGPVDILNIICQTYFQTFRMKARFGNLMQLPTEQCYNSMIEKIQSSNKISLRIRSALWPTERAQAHSLNTWWTVLYWTMLHEAPDPLSDDFGFCLVGGKTTFAGSKDNDKEMSDLQTASVTLG